MGRKTAGLSRLFFRYFMMNLRPFSIFIFTAVLIFVSGLAFLMLDSVSYLEMSHYREAHVLKRIPVNTADGFAVRYTHSVMKTPVWETFQLLPNQQIQLVETIFSSYGAGLPERPEADFEITDQGFRLYNIDQVVDNLVYRTAPADTSAEVTLLVNGEEYGFLDFSSARTPVRIQIKSDPVWVFRIREGHEWMRRKINIPQTVHQPILR